MNPSLSRMYRPQGGLTTNNGHFHSWLREKLLFLLFISSYQISTFWHISMLELWFNIDIHVQCDDLKSHYLFLNLSSAVTCQETLVSTTPGSRGTLPCSRLTVTRTLLSPTPGASSPRRLCPRWWRSTSSSHTREWCTRPPWTRWKT